MPQRRERAGRYIRESDERLIAGTTTMESGTKLVNEYCAKQGYICEPEHEWREAISAVEVPYMQRKKLLEMLDAAKKGLIDVLVVPEIRALARRQVEVLVIYDMLQKYGVRLETVREKFGEDAMSKAILSLRAMFVEIEVEQSKARMMRGRADRILIGQAPNNHPKPAYGYILVDTQQEAKGKYEFNPLIVYVDEEGKEWTEIMIVEFIFDLFRKGYTTHGICRELNDRHIPTSRKGRNGQDTCWQRGGVHYILTNRIYCGEVWANRYKNSKTKNGKKGRAKRPQEDWIRLPDAPAILTPEEMNDIAEQLKINKDEALRSHKGGREELGLLRCGYIYCGICQKKMYPVPASDSQKKRSPNSLGEYRCYGREWREQERHLTTIHITKVDRAVRQLIVEIVSDPNWCREHVKELREKMKKEEPVITREDIEGTIEKIRLALKRLYRLAEQATDDETVDDLAAQMNGLEKQKRDAQLLLDQFDETDEQDVALEQEIQRFEQWAQDARPHLSDPTYVEKAPYAELRLAVRILGITCVAYPGTGDYPHNGGRLFVTIPKVMEKLTSDNIDSLMWRVVSCGSARKTGPTSKTRSNTPTIICL
jgi:site-specific DNA recombinase